MSTGQWFVILKGRVVVSVVARITADSLMWWMAVAPWMREVRIARRLENFVDLDLFILQF
jgi:hypothetical protein